MSEGVSFTVAVCSRDRAASLAETLASLEAADPPGEPWRLLVVDNGPDDAAAPACERFAGRLPLRRVAEPRPGHSAARNAAVVLAEGSHLLWTDDDVRVGRGWLRAYAAAFRRWPEVAFFGSAVVPRFRPEPPAWLLRSLGHCADAFGLVPHVTEPTPITRPDERLPYGSNYAVRLSDQRRHAYDLALGRRPDGLGLGGEETTLLRALVEGGGQGLWLPDAGVEHAIGPERQTADYLWRYYESVGRLHAHWDRAAGRAPRTGPWRARRLRLRYRLARAFAPPERWVPALVRAARARGRLTPA